MNHPLLNPPKSYVDNLKWRIQVTEWIKKHPDKGIVDYIWYLCKEDVIWFFNTFLYTYDPRKQFFKIVDIPFVTFPKQDELIRSVTNAIDQDDDLLVEKSREMGVTWLILGVFLHRFLFFDEEILLVSRKEEEVDKLGDMDTLMEKVRYMIKRLPPYLMPDNFNLKMPHLNIQMPDAYHGAIVGESANADVGRSGRKKAVLIDESQAIYNLRTILQALSFTTNTKIIVGTPPAEGMGHYFSVLRFSEQKNIFTFHWKDDPRKTDATEDYVKEKLEGFTVNNKLVIPKPLVEQDLLDRGVYTDQDGTIRSKWYDKMCMSEDERTIAIELDLNYELAGRPYFNVKICNNNWLKYENYTEYKTGDLKWQVSPYNDDGKIDSSKTKNLMIMGKLGVEFVPNLTGLWRIYDLPEHLNKSKNRYMIASDVAEGLAHGDNSCAAIKDRARNTYIASLMDKVSGNVYAEELFKASIFYNHAWLIIERNNVGLAVILLLQEWNAPQLLRKEVDGLFPQTVLESGFYTHRKNKPIICENLRDRISNNDFICMDERFWGECTNFVQDNMGRLHGSGKRGQEDMAKDDFVMTMAISEYMEQFLPPVKHIKNKSRDAYHYDRSRKTKQSWMFY